MHLNPVHKTNTIEMIGPPGVGKSTLYRSLCSTWRHHFNWIYQEALLMPGKPRFAAHKAWLAYQLRWLFHLKRYKSIPEAYGLRFVEQHKELAQFLWNHLSGAQVYDETEIGKRFRSAYFLFADFCRYQAIEESASPRPCIIEEGFLQKSFLLLKEEQLQQQLINQYVSLLPLPQAVFYVDTLDKNIILQRLQTRKKVLAAHLGKDAQGLLTDVANWQYLFSKIMEKLQSIGVSVYFIDGARPVKDNVGYLHKILQSMNASIPASFNLGNEWLVRKETGGMIPEK